MYLMWMDQSKRPISEKVRDAIAAYREKHGKSPREALIPAALLDGTPDGQVDGVQVIGRHDIGRLLVYVGDND